MLLGCYIKGRHRHLMLAHAKLKHSDLASPWISYTSRRPFPMSIPSANENAIIRHFFVQNKPEVMDLNAVKGLRKFGNAFANFRRRTRTIINISGAA